jgi:hypothetical protein
MHWVADGSVCPICGGPGRNSKRYPAALCRSCEGTLVGRQGRKITFSAAGSDPWGGDIRIEVEGTTFSGTTSIFSNGIECQAREAHLRGMVVQPLEAWKPKTRTDTDNS